MFFQKRGRKTYSLPSVILVVPGQALVLTQEGLTRYVAAKVEGCCFWYGPIIDSNEISVTHVVFPKQVNQCGYFTVPSKSIVEVSAATRSLGTINRAQIHTHPGRWVSHSPYDDDHVVSRNVLSVVLPHYGTTIARWPRSIGVHEFQSNSWHRLTPQQVSRRVRILEGKVELIDLR